MKGLELNGEEIFDFRTLPNASRIRGSIIEKRGHFLLKGGVKQEAQHQHHAHMDGVVLDVLSGIIEKRGHFFHG